MLMLDVEFSLQPAHLFMSFLLSNGPIFLLAFLIVEGMVDEAVKCASCFFTCTVDAHDCIFHVAEEGVGVLFHGRHVGLLSEVPVDSFRAFPIKFLE